MKCKRDFHAQIILPKFNGVCYSCAGGASGFFFFWLVMLLCFATGNGFACFASVLVPDYTLGLTLVNVYTYGGFLLSGFFVTRFQLP
jgi:hypothetical protein